MWLSVNQWALSEDEFKRYTNQVKFISKICGEIDKISMDTNVAGTNEVNAERLKTMIHLIQKVGY